MNNRYNPFSTILFLFMALGTLVLFSSENANATGYLVPGTIRYSANQYDDWDSPDSVGFSGAVDSSYFCRGTGFSGVDLLRFTGIIASVGANPTQVYRGDSDGMGNQKGAFAFISDASGTYTFGIDAASTGTGGSSSARAIIECFNTTLYGNFNTVNAANPVNFLELKNISTSSLDARVIVRSFDGTELTRFTQTIAAGVRADIGLQTITGVANTFGSIVVAHDGALGALVGNVSKYKFDGASLDITATEPLRERTQK